MPLKQTLADLAENVRQTGKVEELDSQELLEEMREPEPPLVVDVREPDERQRGFIPGSIAIPRGVLERDIEKKAFGGQVSDEQLGRRVICYCGGGHRSLLACERLQQLGFTNVASLEGGFGAWGRLSMPVDVER